ncbi:MAG: Glu-tRNA(Gln) amidotransferase subunit GatD [Candidatus Pacearchaeota archaeon]
MKFHVEIGSKIRIRTKDQELEGIALESYDPKIILVKLNNGYNVGFNKKDILNLEKICDVKKEKRERVVEQDKKLPKIVIIATGGTIASKVDYATGGVLAVGKPQDLLESYPELKNVVQFEIQVPYSIDSSQISSREWKKLARLVAKILNRKDIKGVVILHGTDTLHYTSSALAFMLHNLNKPVVLTYSQRSIDRGSSDAHLNLKCACYMALSDVAEVMIVGHENTNDLSCLALRGTKVRKMHSSERAAFKAVNDVPIARIFPDGKIEILNHKYRKRNLGKVKALAFFNEKTALVKFFPGANTEILNDLIKRKYKGIIIEAFGMGQICVKGKNSWLPAIKKAISKNIIIGITSQTISGRVNPYVYTPARKLEKEGVLFLKDMLAETAFVKLGWLLGQQVRRNSDKVKKLMLENFSGEFNERLVL